MTTTDVKFGDWIGKGFDLFRRNIVTLVVASLVAWAASFLTMGILAAPMLAGMVIIALQISKDEESAVDVDRLFEGFEFFLQVFLFLLVWAAIMVAVCIVLATLFCIGYLAAVTAVVVVSALLMFAPFLMVDKKMSFWDASMASINAIRPRFAPLMGYALVVFSVGAMGALYCGIGVVVTSPIALCMLTVAYRELGVGEMAPEPVAEPTPPPAPAADVEVSGPVAEAPAEPETADSADEEPKPQD
jgi:uncharacterized membrane protein